MNYGKTQSKLDAMYENFKQQKSVKFFSDNEKSERPSRTSSTLNHCKAKMGRTKDKTKISRRLTTRSTRQLIYKMKKLKDKWGFNSNERPRMLLIPVWVAKRIGIKETKKNNVKTRSSCKQQIAEVLRQMQAGNRD